MPPSSGRTSLVGFLAANFIKSAYSITKDFFRNMDRFEHLHPGYNISKNLIYSGETLPERINGVRCINYSDIAPFFADSEKYIPQF